MKKRKGRPKKRSPQGDTRSVSETRTPYGEALGHEEFDRALRKVSRRLSDVKKPQDDQRS
jgi:hypothetical protein